MKQSRSTSSVPISVALAHSTHASPLVIHVQLELSIDIFIVIGNQIQQCAACIYIVSLFWSPISPWIEIQSYILASTWLTRESTTCVLGRFICFIPYSHLKGSSVYHGSRKHSLDNDAFDLQCRRAVGIMSRMMAKLMYNRDNGYWKDALSKWNVGLGSSHAECLWRFRFPWRSARMDKYLFHPWNENTPSMRCEDLHSSNHPIVVVYQCSFFEGSYYRKCLEYRE